MINTLMFMYDLTMIQPVMPWAFAQYCCVNVETDRSQNLL